VTWLIDTNVLSELRKGDGADAGVRAWFDGAAESELFTSVLVVGEIRRGIERLRQRDVAAALALEQWLMHIAFGFADRILGIDFAVAERWGRLNVPTAQPTVDGLLAATALEHDLILVTRNVRDVERTEVRCLNPFEA